MIDGNGKHTGEFAGKPDGPTAVRSLELLGRHLGLFIERHEIGEPSQFARMTDEELDAELSAQAKAVGFPQEAIDHVLSIRTHPTKQ